LNATKSSSIGGRELYHPTTNKNPLAIFMISRALTQKNIYHIPMAEVHNLDETPSNPPKRLRCVRTSYHRSHEERRALFRDLDAGKMSAHASSSSGRRKEGKGICGAHRKTGKYSLQRAAHMPLEERHRALREHAFIIGKAASSLLNGGGAAAISLRHDVSIKHLAAKWKVNRNWFGRQLSHEQEFGKLARQAGSGAPSKVTPEMADELIMFAANEHFDFTYDEAAAHVAIPRTTL
jgi:hypothetical protein